MTQTGPDPSDATDPEDGLRGVAGSLAGMLEGYARLLSQIADGAAPRGSTAEDGRPRAIDAPAALIEAGTIASGSSLRYGQQLTDLFARHQGAFAATLPAHLSKDGPSDQDRRDEVEALRQFLRELGETATREARLLNRELDELGEALAQGVGEATPDEDRVRRHKITP